MTISPSSDGSGNSGNIKFTGEQLAIIEAPIGERQLVEAGPGTGKTAVACARIAHLLKAGTNPSSILIVSFTRAAVREMRDRIHKWAGMGPLGGLGIHTVDQTAFRFAKGAGSVPASLMQGFEVTMEAAVKQLRDGQGDVLKFVKSLNHLLVDEAQDLTDIRSEFIEAIIAAMPQDAGVTALADSCQAIYGFTHDQDESGQQPPRLFLKAFSFGEHAFVRRSLTVLHRTQDKNLATFFLTTRKALLSEENDTALNTMVSEVTRGRESLGDKVDSYELKDGDLVLFRWRKQAIMAAQFYPSLHRLRMPGYPAALFPWIALCFSKCTATSVDRKRFESLWSENVPGKLADGWTPAGAFDALLAVTGGDDRVDMKRLRVRLAQPRPPIELCYQDCGGYGPIF